MNLLQLSSITKKSYNNKTLIQSLYYNIGVVEL